MGQVLAAVCMPRRPGKENTPRVVVLKNLLACDAEAYSGFGTTLGTCLLRHGQGHGGIGSGRGIEIPRRVEDDIAQVRDAVAQAEPDGRLEVDDPGATQCVSKS